MTRGRLAAGVLIAVALAAAILFLQAERTGGLVLQAEQPSSPFARSLEGTVPDGTFHNGRGDLVLGEALLDRFEYYLTTLGERTLDEVRVQIDRELDKELKPADASAAKQLFGRYVEFKAALATLKPTPTNESNPVAAVRRQQEQVRAIRAKHFTPLELATLFGERDRLDADALARIEIQRDSTLTPGQKQEQLAALDAQLPARIREGRAPDAKHHGLMEAEAAARARGASEADLFKLRAEWIGAGAAERLAAEDREEAAWRQRIHAYLTEKNRLMAQAGLAEADRQTQIQRLREQSFTAEERLRLGAYE